jgi:hypothetical protein
MTAQQLAGVQINANNGIVTLRGNVGSAAQRQMLISRVRGMSGVRSVVDGLTVGPNRVTGTMTPGGIPIPGGASTSGTIPQP